MDKKIISELKNYLDCNLYDVLYAEICHPMNYNINPWQTENTILGNIRNYDIEVKTMFKFLLLGHRYLEQDIRKILGDHLIDILKTISMIEKIENYIYVKMSLISHHGLYFFVDIPNFYSNHIKNTPDVYIGADTYMLADFLPKNRKTKVLDMCSGSGIQGITIASIADEVVCAELNPKAIPYLKLNIALNDVADTVHAIESDLYTEIEEERFDMIISNPPFIPVPAEVEYPVCGTGGEDGLSIIKEILSGFNKHLKEEGIAIIIGECLGKLGNTLLMDVIKEMLPRNYEVTLFLHNKISINVQINNVVKYCRSFLDVSEEELRSKWKETYNKLGVDEYYGFYLHIQKKTGSKKYRTIVSQNRVEYKNRIICENCKFERTDELFCIWKDSQLIGKVNAVGKKIFEMANNKTVEQLVTEVSNEYNETSEKGEMEELVIRICEYFWRIGLIKI